jgi:hypothetical protein
MRAQYVNGGSIVRQLMLTPMQPGGQIVSSIHVSDQDVGTIPVAGSVAGKALLPKHDKCVGR